MQSNLDTYFSLHWKSDITKFTLSGLNLVNKIKENEYVLDVGCGDNHFKNKIKNLIGIDPVNKLADINTTIEDFNCDIKFDVAFCLGSINFGDEERIINQITKLITHLKDSSRIYWRCNPGINDHNNEYANNINFYPWSFQKHFRLSKMFGYYLNDMKWEQNNIKRIYAEWIK